MGNPVINKSGTVHFARRLGSRICLFLFAMACAATVIPASSQRAGASGARGKPGRRQEQPPARFGDVEISGSQKIYGTFNHVTVEGPNSTVDVVNQTEPNTKTRIQASKMTVFFDEKTGKATRMEAEGSFRFSGTRPTKDKKGIQTFSGTGSKAIYLKSEGRLNIEGPVTFRGEQPSADAASKKSVDGTASAATFNDQTEVLTLEGGFKVLFKEPGVIAPPGAEFVGGKLTADLSKSPIEFESTPHKGYERITFTPVEKPKKKEKK